MSASDLQQSRPLNPKERSLHRAYLCLGSNIEPEENMQKAVSLLREMALVDRLSGCYETRAVGSNGPNFLNMAVSLLTILDPKGLKEKLIKPIEQRLGRVRVADKNAPRTIDLDVIVYDEQVLDEDLWQRVYLALPFSDLLPNLPNPRTSETLRETAQRLLAGEPVTSRPEIEF